MSSSCSSAAADPWQLIDRISESLAYWCYAVVCQIGSQAHQCGYTSAYAAVICTVIDDTSMYREDRVQRQAYELDQWYREIMPVSQMWDTFVSTERLAFTGSLAASPVNGEPDMTFQRAWRQVLIKVRDALHSSPAWWWDDQAKMIKDWPSFRAHLTEKITQSLKSLLPVSLWLRHLRAAGEEQHRSKMLIQQQQQQLLMQQQQQQEQQQQKQQQQQQQQQSLEWGSGAFQRVSPPMPVVPTPPPPPAPILPPPPPSSSHSSAPSVYAAQQSQQHQQFQQPPQPPIQQPQQIQQPRIPLPPPAPYPSSPMPYQPPQPQLQQQHQYQHQHQHQPYYPEPPGLPPASLSSHGGDDE